MLQAERPTCLQGQLLKCDANVGRSLKGPPLATRSSAQEDSDKTNMIQLNEVFTNHSKDDEIYPLTFTEIVDAQKADTKLKDFLNPMQL